MKRLNAYLLVVLVSAVLLAFSSLPAYAVDGVVLINQGTATNGLPGCPTSGTFYLIVICHAGSYRLSGNLIASSNKPLAIFINVDNVSVDLNGFSITCSGTCDVGIDTSNSNIKVSNGTVRGFVTSGVQLTGGNEVVDKLQAENDGMLGIYIGFGMVSNSVANGNQDGILVDGDGLVTGNYVQGNSVAGINVVGNVSITNNLIAGNGNGTPGYGGIVFGGGSALVGYGSNTFGSNRNNVVNQGGLATSMNNNACTTGVC